MERFLEKLKNLNSLGLDFSTVNFNGVRLRCPIPTGEILTRAHQYDTIRYDTIRYDTIRYDTIQYNTIFI